MKTAVYARVSTAGQDTDNQVDVLKEYCLRRGQEVYDVYVDKGISGSKESRPELDRLLKDAQKRRFDCLLVWKLDRLGRSLKHLLVTLENLESVGVAFICYQDNIDTTTPAGRLMFQMVGAFAEFERSLIRERVKAGLVRARKQGKKLGRPKVQVNKYKIMQMRNEGMSYRAIAKITGISHVTIGKNLDNI